ncbi:MAG TPA: hypothetical protein VHJ20_14885 [Polyangia bacterium]|nr:hypothetical protein [Polyangia bacterium]
MSAARAGAILMVAILAAPVVARAGEASEAGAAPLIAGVRLGAPSCPILPVAWPDFVEALRVELAGRAPSTPPTGVALAIEPCDVGTKSVRVAIDGGPARDVGLEDVAPAARPRALALAVAELVRETPVPPAPPPPAAPPPTPMSPPAPLVRTASHPYHATYGIEGLGRYFPSRHTDQWGGRLALGDEQPGTHWELFLEALTGGRRVDAGDVVVQSFGAGYALGPVTPIGRARLRSALAVAFDWTRVEGASPSPGVQAQSGGGLTIALGARFALALPVGGGAWLHAFVEPAWALRHLDADVDGAPVAGVHGPSVSFGIGGVYERP